MYTVALFARLEAKPGKEDEVAKFLETGLAVANQEATTPIWFALRLGPAVFGIFDAFAGESGREAHLNGPIAKALMAQAPELLASDGSNTHAAPSPPPHRPTASLEHADTALARPGPVPRVRRCAAVLRAWQNSARAAGVGHVGHKVLRARRIAVTFADSSVRACTICGNPSSSLRDASLYIDTEHE